MTDEVRFERHVHGTPRHVLDATGITYLVAVIVFLGAYLFLVSFPEAIDYLRIRSVKHADIGYSGRAPGPALTEATQFPGRRLADDEDLRISFNVRVTGTGAHDNLFQTAPVNSGVRMELGQPSVLALIVGAREPAGFSGFIVSHNFEPGRWHSVRISISRDEQIRTFLDGKLALDVKDPKLDYTISDIAFGTGFSKTRPFSGELSSVSMTYRLYRKTWLLSEPVLPLKLLFLTLLTLAAAGFICRVSAVVVASVGLVREQKIDIIVLIVLAGFVLSVFFHYFMGAYMHMGYPFNSFLLNPRDRFMDYFNGLTYVTAGYGAGMGGAGGLAYSMWWFLYLISFKNANLSFAIYTLAIAMYVLFYNLKNLVSGPSPKRSPVKLMRSLLILSFLSYPVLFTLDRGNIEGFAFILLSLGLYFFCSNRAGISTVFLAAATALKVYPIVFIILYLAEKKYKEAAIFVGALLVLSAFAYDGTQGFSFHLLRFISFVKGSGGPENTYNAVYVLGDAGAAFSSTAYGALKAVIYAWDPRYSGPLLLSLFRTYYPVSFLLFALVALYVIIVEKELWKRIAILTLGMIFFPYVAADYKLINLYIPMWLFLNSKERSGADLLYAILFGLLLVPKAYYPIKDDISISVILNPLIISIFLLSIIAIGLRKVSVTDIKRSMGEHLTAARSIFTFTKIHSVE